jgi:hypothetical protein
MRRWQPKILRHQRSDLNKFERSNVWWDTAADLTFAQHINPIFERALCNPNHQIRVRRPISTVAIMECVLVERCYRREGRAGHHDVLFPDECGRATPDQRLLVGAEAEGWNCAAGKVIWRVSTGRTEAGSLSLDQRYENLVPTNIESRVTS